MKNAKFSQTKVIDEIDCSIDDVQLSFEGNTIDQLVMPYPNYLRRTK